MTALQFIALKHTFLQYCLLAIIIAYMYLYMYLLKFIPYLVLGDSKSPDSAVSQSVAAGVDESLFTIDREKCDLKTSDDPNNTADQVFLFLFFILLSTIRSCIIIIIYCINAIVL